MSEQTSPHRPVLVQEVLDELAPQVGDSYLDLTAGYGGHAQAILEKTEAPSKAVLIDRDETAVRELQRQFQSQAVKVIRSDFLSALRRLASENQTFDMVLADLGVSSPHLENPARGFSFSRPGPLDMRMDQDQPISAASIVNELPAKELAAILKEYGEEPRAAKIAEAIVAARPIKDTGRLAEAIRLASGGRRGKTDPATRSFQAIRIAVNDELGQLKAGLPLMVQVLAPGGRLAIISFHSLEDRLVKNFFAEHAANTYDSQLTALTKKPVTASPDEIASNPRARSAKLRAVAKIKTNRKDT